MHRVTLALGFIALFGLLAWLYAIDSPVAQWVVPGGALVLLVAAAIRAALAPRGRRVRSALAPATDALEGMQDIYLARPGSRPEYPEAPPVPTLIDDRAVPEILPQRRERPTNA